MATEVCASAGYGIDLGSVAVAEDELGDALFALLALRWNRTSTPRRP